MTTIRRRVRTLVAAAVYAAVSYYAADGLRMLVQHLVGPYGSELREISTLALAAALGGTFFLWLDLRATRAALTSIARSQAVVETELALAAEVQRRLLPSVPAGLAHAQWATRLRPAGKIGGDFYDFIPTNGDGLLVLVGDVSGKGIPAALLQASAHSLFRSYSRRLPQPAPLLRRVSREIYAENRGALYVTCLAVHVDAASRTLTYVNAGHPPGLFFERSGRRVLSQGGPPLGMFEETLYDCETITMEHDALGVVVTDGITEALEQDGVPAIDRLSAIISTFAPLATPESICDALMDLADHGGGPSGVKNWQDDKTVLVFRVDAEHEFGWPNPDQPDANPLPAAAAHVQV
jgi:sigma-B regulation protein RsbU (phosphoserine phosphatase)